MGPKNTKRYNEPRTYVSDMRHFLNENGLAPIGMPKEFYAMLDYHSAVVKAGSSHPRNAQFNSAVPCRRRPGRKPCATYLAINHRSDDVIHWQCPSCGEQGFISNWQGTIYDLSGFAELDPTQRVSVMIGHDEYKLLRGIITSSQEEDAIIGGAVSTPDGVLLSGSVDDFDLLLGSVAFDANHAEMTRRQRAMDRIYESIQCVVEG